MVVLRCIDQAGVKGELRPETTASGFRELGSYHFFSPVDGVTLYIDEAPAEVIRIDGVQGWRWQPGFYAGEVVAELVSATGQRLAEYKIDVSPDEGKLGDDVFRSMLDELYAFDPALLLGTEAAQAGIGVSGEVVSPLLEYARLRRYADGFLAALNAVTMQPLTRLRRQRALIPYHRVRKLDAASARSLLRRPDTAAFLHSDVAFAEGAIPLFDVTHSIDDLDNPANRALTSKILAVRRRCIQVADALQDMVAKEEEAATRTPLQPRLARKLESLGAVADKLAHIARSEPFASVTRVEVTAAGLNAISAHPSYARAYRFAWSVLRPGVAGETSGESLWLSPTWEIYERWCFARITACLREMFGALEWNMTYAGRRSDCIKLVGEGQNIRLEASLQSCFHSEGAAKGGFQSISMQLKPDILITVESRDERRMLVLDAKYRTSRHNVLDAMRSAHLYQDALRWDRARPACSILLVPRGGGAPWLEEPNFQATHKVGVHVLAPNSAETSLRKFLERWLTPGVVVDL